MNGVLKQIEEIGIVPVVKIDNAEKAVPLARALCRGGLPVAEVTFRTSAGEEAIRRIAQEVPEMLLGAGTVLTVDQVDCAVEAGARFVVSPGLNPEVVKHCIERGVVVIPGCATPSDVEKAMSFGLNAVKFFPAEAAGGLPMIRAMAAPYGGVRFMPTGGINAQNLNRYLADPKVLACGGSWMVREELIAAGDFDEIERITADAVRQMLHFELAHVGVNARDDEEAMQAAQLLCQILSLPMDERPISFFAGTMVEVMKGCGRGSRGHIGIRCTNVERAMRFLAAKGIAFEQDSFDYRADGVLNLVYLKTEICGFAVHLVRA
jgi:2-dehydro-3-deoxyphosphogluconate aldolase/(4S)-4-hydroxy-2-oxoglutarate aldolase